MSNGSLAGNRFGEPAAPAEAGLAVAADAGSADTAGVAALGGAIPGWLLRAILGVVTVAAIVIAMSGAPQIGVGSVVGILLLLGALGTVLAPGSVLPLVVLACVVLYRIAAAEVSFDGRLVALVALLPLIHQLAGICATIPARSACALRALRPMLIRYLSAVVPVVAVIVGVIIAG